MPERDRARLRRVRRIVRASDGPRSSAPNHRGPQDPAVVCPADGRRPPRCDDSLVRQGHRRPADLRRRSSSRASRRRCGSPWPAPTRARPRRSASTRRRRATRRRCCGPRVDERHADRRQTAVDLPGDRLLQQSVEWSKQNLADSVQEAARPADPRRQRGQGLPGAGRHGRRPRAGSAPASRTTRGCSAPTASTPRSPRSPPASSTRSRSTCARCATSATSSTTAAARSCTRSMPTGDVYFGSNHERGQHRRDGEVPERGRAGVALDRRRPVPRRDVRLQRPQPAVRLPRSWTRTATAGSRASATSSAPGMGVEKLDSTVYLVRGLRDLADMAASKHDTTTQQWATTKATDLESRFEAQWWVAAGERVRRLDRRPGRPGERQHADLPAALDRRDADGGRAGPAGSRRLRWRRPSTRTTALDQRENALLHRRIRAVPHRHRPDLRPGRQPRPVVRQRGVDGEERARHVRAEHRRSWRLPRATSVGWARSSSRSTRPATRASSSTRRSGRRRARCRRSRRRPTSPANIGRPFYDRSMSLQAWGAYGILWPVVAPAARRRPGPRARPGRGRPAAAGGPAEGGR